MPAPEPARNSFTLSPELEEGVTRPSPAEAEGWGEAPPESAPGAREPVAPEPPLTPVPAHITSRRTPSWRAIGRRAARPWGVER